MLSKIFIFLAFQAIAKPIGTSGYTVKSIKMYLNLYTLPGYFMFIFSIINMVFLMFYFVEDLDVKKITKMKIKQLHRRGKFWILLTFIFSVHFERSYLYQCFLSQISYKDIVPVLRFEPKNQRLRELSNLFHIIIEISY